MNEYSGDFIQNRFTRYLMTAVARERMKFFSKRQRIETTEIFIPELLDTCIPNFDEIHEMIVAEKTERAAQNWEKTQELLRLIDNDKVEKAVEKLREKERTVLLGRVFGELSFDELGVKTGLTGNQAKQMYFYALRKLRKELKK